MHFFFFFNSPSSFNGQTISCLATVSWYLTMRTYFILISCSSDRQCLVILIVKHRRCQEVFLFLAQESISMYRGNPCACKSEFEACHIWSLTEIPETYCLQIVSHVVCIHGMYLPIHKLNQVTGGYIQLMDPIFSHLSAVFTTKYLKLYILLLCQINRSFPSLPERKVFVASSHFSPFSFIFGEKIYSWHHRVKYFSKAYSNKKKILKNNVKIWK